MVCMFHQFSVHFQYWSWNTMSSTMLRSKIRSKIYVLPVPSHPEKECTFDQVFYPWRMWTNHPTLIMEERKMLEQLSGRRPTTCIHKDRFILRTLSNLTSLCWLVRSESCVEMQTLQSGTPWSWLQQIERLQFLFSSFNFREWTVDQVWRFNQRHRDQSYSNFLLKLHNIYRFFRFFFMSSFPN